MNFGVLLGVSAFKENAKLVAMSSGFMPTAGS
jgi:hypothetical protein